jgi:ATP-binding cassette subfamily B protein
MTTAPQPAPDDRGRLPALLQPRPFARPYRGLMVLTFSAALLATLARSAGLHRAWADSLV